MQGRPGDRVVIEGNRLGTARRQGEIVEVLHGPSGDHFRVRWETDQHESIFYPGADSHIEPGDRSN